MTTGRYKSGREPFEIIEIDQDFCNLTYGASPCTASLGDGNEKCRNTIGTCQDTPNYDGGVLTLRFCTDTPNLPTDGVAYFPFLIGSPKVKPAELNPGGAKSTSTALGKRATISVKMSDAPWNDKIVDKYQAERISGVAQDSGIGYDPVERSTFWRKWKARNLYYLNRPMRYISGYVENGQLVDTVTRYFVITGFSGPDKSGNISFEGQDILYLAQREKAQAPIASKGKLVADITDSSGSFTLNPVGIGDAEYPASGWGRFNSEIIQFTRSGDTFTVTSDGRGQYRTIASAHTAGDTFQLCLVFESRRPDQILYTLLSDYSEIDDSFLDTVQWEAEALDHLPSVYDAVISSPTGVAELISEMCEQMYFYVWFDERVNKVKMLSVRPADGEVVTPLTEDNNIVSGSLICKDEPDQVITRVVINYALFDPTQDTTDQSNFRVTDIFGDLLEEGADRNRGSRTKVINSRWLSGGNAAAAEQLGERLLARYRVPPRTITWQMDAKDRDLWVADFCTINTDSIVDASGVSYPVPVQVLSASEHQAGTTFTYMGQQFLFELPPSPNVRPLVQAANRNDLNIRDWYDERYPDSPPASDTIVNVTIRPAIVIGSTSTATPAMTIGMWPAGAEVNITIEAGAYVVGKGGAGGKGGGVSGSGSRDGFNGGLAVEIDYPVRIANYGTIAGGGGGAGGGASGYGAITAINDGVYGGGGGGAGAGITSSAGGPRGVGDVNGKVGNASNLVPGEGGDPGKRSSSIRGGAGGRGGELAQPGDGGQSRGNATSSFNSQSAGSGGAAGAAIDGISNVTWVNKGDVRGAEI